MPSWSLRTSSYPILFLTCSRRAIQQKKEKLAGFGPVSLPVCPLWDCAPVGGTSGLGGQGSDQEKGAVSRAHAWLTPADLLQGADFSLARCTRDSKHSSGGPCLSGAGSSSLSTLRLSSCSFSEEASFSLQRQKGDAWGPSSGKPALTATSEL